MVLTAPRKEARLTQLKLTGGLVLYEYTVEHHPDLLLDVDVLHKLKYTISRLRMGSMSLIDIVLCQSPRDVAAIGVVQDVLAVVNTDVNVRKLGTLGFAKRHKHALQLEAVLRQSPSLSIR